MLYLTVNQIDALMNHVRLGQRLEMLVERGQLTKKQALLRLAANERKVLKLFNGPAPTAAAA